MIQVFVFRISEQIEAKFRKYPDRLIFPAEMFHTFPENALFQLAAFSGICAYL